MEFEVTILGSNSAMPAHGRHQTAQVVRYHDHYYLIDCGEGTQERILKSSIKLQKIRQIFISHLHGDHFLGLLPLLNTMSLMGRTDPLTIYCPEGLEELIQIFLSVSRSMCSYALECIVIDSERSYQIFEDEYLRVYSIPMNHRIPCTGFVFEEKERLANILGDRLPISINTWIADALRKGIDVTHEGVFLKASDLTTPPPPSRKYTFYSDTRVLENVFEYAQNADLFYHETTYSAIEEQKAHERFHSTTKQAATYAKVAKAKKLIIGHFSSRYIHLEPLLLEAKEIFPNSELALENSIFQIETDI